MAWWFGVGLLLPLMRRSKPPMLTLTWRKGTLRTFIDSMRKARRDAQPTIYSCSECAFYIPPYLYSSPTHPSFAGPRHLHPTHPSFARHTWYFSASWVALTSVSRRTLR